jgi:hypothetical protein
MHIRHTIAACLQVSKMPKWKVKGVDPDTRTAINTEWGCYGSELLPRVKEDLELDAASGPQQGERPAAHLICVFSASTAQRLAGLLGR